MSLLREAGWFSKYNEPTDKVLKSSETVDRWITEVLCRLHLHDETFNLFFLNRPPANDDMLSRGGAPCTFGKTELPWSFAYMEDAWACADRLLLAAIYLTQDCKVILAAGSSPTSDQSLTIRRKQLQTDLARWSKAFDRSRGAPFKLARGEYDQSPALIQISLTMATILTDTSLFVDDTTIYDRHTDNFRRLLDSTAHMVRIHQEQSSRQRMGMTSLTMSFTIFDTCTLPVFYFTATRCRVFEVRRQALAALSLLRHRECHWDGWLAYTVAKKVVELERGDAYDGGSNPNIKMASDGTMIPASSRLQNQRIITSGDPFTTLSLEFDRADVMKNTCTHRVVLDVQSGVWTDEVDDNTGTISD
jgi:hypothetical protein